MLEILDILRRRVSATIGRLVVGAFCIDGQQKSIELVCENDTVAVDCAVSTRLLPVTFNLFSSAFVASSSHSSPLLQMT